MINQITPGAIAPTAEHPLTYKQAGGSLIVRKKM